MRHEEGTFIGSGGLRLYRQSWHPDATEATAGRGDGDPTLRRSPGLGPRAGQEEVGAVVLVHGYAEHSGRYAHVADALVRAGWATFTFDQRGHGRSEGRRAVTDGLDLLLADVDRVVDEATSALGGRKPVLLGHSMGGGIAAAYALCGAPGGGAGQAKLTALVLSGPGLGLSAVLNAPQRLGARVISAVAPTAGVNRLPASAVSRDPAVVAAYERDPLVHHGKVPARTAQEMLRASDLVGARAGELRLPLLILHGSADQLVPVGGSRLLDRNAGSADKTLKVYDGLYHEVFNEPEQDKVLADLVGWLGAHRPAPA